MNSPENRSKEGMVSSKRTRELLFDDRADFKRQGFGDRDRPNDRGRHRDGRGYHTEERRRDHDQYQERSQPASWDNRADEWNCNECGAWNEIRCTSCHRCGVPRPRGRSETRSRDQHGEEAVDEFGRSRVHNDDDVDEFGRKKDSLSKPRPEGPRWPPPFERRSALYVFDARSGMFYHASSQFFYDPKTKLYFGNKEQKYYEFCKGEQPPFKEFRPRTVETSKEEVKAEDKKLISISLKTKVLASAGKDSDTKESAPAAGVAVSKSQKAHDANMELWAERGREIRGKEQVVRTKLGQPVCLLCKRKFPDIQKLERHESFSELHKSNLLKYGKKMNVADDMAEAHYRDRALERRVLHGPEFIEQTLSVTAESAGNLGLPAGSLPEENLGDSNVGSQMLQKLGWKKGSNLGKISGEVEAGKLVKDWERIERLARSGKP